MGGNESFFELLKDYEIVDLPMNAKYSHPAVVWYQKYHRAKMDGRDHIFENPMPPKDLNERIGNLKKSASVNLKEFESKSDLLIDKMV